MINSIFNIKSGKKAFAMLIDPDKYDENRFKNITNTLSPYLPNVILIGGSLLFKDIDTTIISIKKITKTPVFLFPGSHMQLSKLADGVLFTSLISGRNPDFLIGNQVNAAPFIKTYKLKTLATGYMLIGNDKETSVRYISNTLPIPYNKPEIAVATALAGEFLGLQSIYLEAGSGADTHVSTNMIEQVKQNINIPIIVGGGIKTKQNIEDIYNAGANTIVIGTAFENNYINIKELKSTIKHFCY